jgi:4-azaleucine resistance transporter AzlC
MSVPVLTGYVCLGIGFGLVLESKGFGVLWAFAMGLLVYAGSMQYVAIDLLTGGATLLATAITTLMVNARHLFYGISMIDKYKDAGVKKPYMIFSLTDETYSLYFLTKTPPDVDEGEFLFALATLDQSYWIIGSIIGAVAGTLIPFDSTGIDFAMTALFIVIFVEQWFEKKNRFPAIVGVIASGICLLIFGKDSFILPSMIVIMLILLSNHRIEEKKNKTGEVKVDE